MDSQGKSVLLHGANVEFLNVDDQIAAQNSEQIELSKNVGSRFFSGMSRLWKMNSVRIPVSCWLWKKNPQRYLQMIKRVVAEANDSGLYVVLALHAHGAWNGSPYPDLRISGKSDDPF